MWWISEIRTEEDASFCLKYMMLQMEFLKLMFKNLRAQLYNFIQKSEWMHKCFFWSFYLASRSLIEQDTRKLFFFFFFLWFNQNSYSADWISQPVISGECYKFFFTSNLAIEKVTNLCWFGFAGSRSTDISLKR